MGWTWDYIDWHVDLPRLSALSKYWLKHPPAHVALNDIRFMLEHVFHFEREAPPREYVESNEDAIQQQQLDELLDQYLKTGT